MKRILFGLIFVLCLAIPVASQAQVVNAAYHHHHHHHHRA
jgi:hypothetical protein